MSENLPEAAERPSLRPHALFANFGALVVDDEEPIRRTSADILRRFGFARVHVAADGVEALSILQQHGDSIHVMLLDIVMPRMDGLSLLRHLIQVHDHPVGVVIMSGYSPSDTKIMEVLDDPRSHAGLVFPTRFLPKPWTVAGLEKELLDAVQAVMLKRDRIFRGVLQGVARRLDSLDARTAPCDRILPIEARLSELDKRVPGFVAQLGLDVLRIILIAAATVALLSTGLGDLLRSILR